MGMDAFFAIFAVMFVLIFCVFLFSIVRGIGEWANNNRQPVLSENGRVVSKRVFTNGTAGGNNAGGMVTTSYFTTFELPSGERKEFQVAGREYGQLSEGDNGTLTHQGTRYLGFQRGGAAPKLR